MPRPPIQHHRLLLTLPDNWEDVLDEIKKIVAIQAVGRASAGFLGNPAIGLWLIGGVVAIIAGLVGKAGADVIFDFFAKLEALRNAEQGQDQRDAAFDFTNAQRALVEFFFPAFKFVPPLEPEEPPPPTGGAPGGGGAG